MIKWILEHLGIVVVVVLFISQMFRAVLQARKTAAEREQEVATDDGSEQRRVREVQEQIRRQIAARRAGQATTEPPPLVEPRPAPRPLPRAETTQMPEPFGGPLGRMLEELQKRAQQHAAPAVPPPMLVEKRNLAEFERQRQIADELKAVEDARLVAKRRAAHHAADLETVAQSEPALRTVAHNRMLVDLRDPQSLRRAIVLREVLGPPVGLR